MKTFIRILTLALVTVLLCMAVCAEEVKPVFVTLNGQAVDCASYGQDATIVDGRTMVPLRAIFEALGASVEWNAETRTVSSKLGDTEISLTIGENKLVRNGEEVALDVPAMIMNDRTLVPVRAVSESFGVAVEWDKNTRTVILTQTEPLPSEKPEEIMPSEDEKAVPAEAKQVLENWLNAVLCFDFNEAAKYTTKPELFTALGLSGLDDLLDGIGYSREEIIEVYMSSLGEGQEDALPFCEAVADVSLDIIRGTYSKLTFKPVSYEMEGEDKIKCSVAVYLPDTTSFEESTNALLGVALAAATQDLDGMADALEGKSTGEIFEELGRLFKKHAAPLVAEFVDSITLVTDEDLSEGVLVRVNGEWLVEMDEEDSEMLAKIAENGFANIIG